MFIFFLLTPVAASRAQNVATVIDTLALEFWPDYDKASVLFLLTGTLPDDTKLPAAVTLRIPETAQLNAVARIDRKDDRMMDDIVSSTSPSGMLTFITPDLRFRVEYYFPYTINDSLRSFDFTWLADLSVNKLQLKVQQPLSASFLDTDPKTENVVKSGDGFYYHIHPVRSVPSGQPFSVHVEYKMTAATLSAENLSQQNSSRQPPGTTDKSTIDSRVNWPLVAMVAGGLIIIIVLIWQMIFHRRSSDNLKPVHKGEARQSRQRFCRNCGEPIEEGDKFCGGCGESL